ncbi:MAG: DNA polymerase III subunit delta [Gammaproteobacteria bacterium]
MKFSADRLADHLASRLGQVYLISGDEPLLVDEAADSIRRCAREQGFEERERHVAGAGFDWDGLSAGSANMSLFASRKLVELRLPTGKPGTKGGQAIADFASSITEDTCLLVFAPKLAKAQLSTKWVKAIDAAGFIVQVWSVDTGRLPRWIEQRMRAKGLVPVGDAVQILCDRVQGNLLAADQEIEKLLLARGAGNVDGQIVAQSVADSARFDVFSLSDSALLGDSARAIRVLDGLRSEGVDGTLILWALVREVRILCSVLNAVESGASLEKAMAAQRVWSSRTTMVARAARRVRRSDQAYRLLDLCAQCDAVIKGQHFKADPWERLTTLTLAICGAVKRWPAVA